MTKPRERAAAVHHAMRAREVALMGPLMDFLRGRNALRVLGPGDPALRAPTVAILAERRGEDLAGELAAHGIMAGGGDFYSVRCLEALGIDPGHGVLRVSFTHYTSQGEVARLISTLDRVL